jgi:phage terminase large subunit GpA-like protein
MPAPPKPLFDEEWRRTWSRAAHRRALRQAAKVIRDRLRLPPRLTLSEWSDSYRVLSPEASAEPGPWRTERVPYLREIMDTISGRDYQDITVVAASQTAKSEALLNAIGYYIDQEPSSILVIQPNVKPMAEAFSKRRIAPMIRDSSRLRGKVKDPRSRNSGNTIQLKEFPGGNLIIMGANSPAGLSSNPIRVVLADEIDRWEKSAGTEGDPLSLADARQVTYRHRKKMVKVSSPGNEGESRIEREWMLSDQRHYYVPCPHCGHEQPLEWRDSGGRPDIRPGRNDWRVVWEKEDIKNGDEIVEVRHRPETAVYICRSCACTIEETHKAAMLAAGRWVKHNPKSRRAGFHIPGLISPWVRWSELAEKWLSVKDEDELRKTFFNTKLGLLYVSSGEDVDFHRLANADRRDAYAAEVPMGGGLLTMFIDVQDDRIECDVRGWGAKEESWHIRIERFYGDPDLDDVWQRAEALLTKSWAHESGAELRIRVCMVDSGFKQDAVFRWVKAHQGAQVYATKGVDNLKQPLARATRANRDGVKVFNFNPTVFKDTLFSRLKRRVAGPGYMHFGPTEMTGADDGYYLQYAAEKRSVSFEHNRPVVVYKNPGRKRNEAIDLYVGNLVALRSLGMSVANRLGEIVQEVQAEGEERRAAAEKVSDGSGQPEPEKPAPRSRASWWRGYR